MSGIKIEVGVDGRVLSWDFVRLSCMIAWDPWRATLVEALVADGWVAMMGCVRLMVMQTTLLSTSIWKSI